MSLFHSSHDAHTYQEPLPTDARGPCPFLNTMANHGYLPRTGRYITLYGAIKAMMDCYNFDFPLAFLLASAGIWTSLFSHANPLWFDLAELQVHNKISVEHDASLTRADIKTGDNWHPDLALIHQLLSFSSSANGLISLEDFARYRVQREETIPKPFTGIRSVLNAGEIGLILGALGKGSDSILERKITPDWVNAFFVADKLPPDWKRPDMQVKLLDVNEVRKKVQKIMEDVRKLHKSQ